MKRQVASPIVIALLATLLGYSWGQKPALRGADDPRAAEFPVAVVDMGKVLQGYKGLTEKKEELQRDYQKIEETVKERFEDIKRLQEEAKSLKPGTPDHKRATEELNGKAQKFEAYRREQQQAFVEAQSKMALWAYERVVEQVQQFADARGIKLVLHANPVPVEGKNPQEILAGLSRQVVYQNTLDITEEILQALN
ncbi:MAG: OmpH family outer membrane protein [Planctomycetales bacterium]